MTEVYIKDTSRILKRFSGKNERKTLTMNSLKFYNFRILDGSLIQTATCLSLPLESEEDSFKYFSIVSNYL